MTECQCEPFSDFIVSVVCQLLGRFTMLVDLDLEVMIVLVRYGNGSTVTSVPVTLLEDGHFHRDTES